MKKPKRKPRREELKHYKEDVKDRHGKDYTLSVSDKQADDGELETHFDFSPQFRPGGSKSRGNFATGLKRCIGACRCPGKTCEKKK